jgi:DNA-binding transcriptional LysR family regulator
MKFLERAEAQTRIECSPLGQLMQRLDDGRLDFALGIFDNLAPRFRRQLLYKESYVSVVRAGHPALDGIPRGVAMGLDTYLRYRHLQVSPRSDDRSVMVRALMPVGRQRDIACVINDFVAAPAILMSTDLVGTFPARLVSRAPAAFIGLETRPLPIELPAQSTELIWHERTHNLAAHTWIRDAIAEICAGALAVRC